jgi:hypothetical protein
MNSLLAAMLGEPSPETPFLSSIRLDIEREIREYQINYSWEANEYKLYPSSIASLTFCPYRYIREDVHKPLTYDTKAKYKMLMGGYIHKMYQERAMTIPGLLWQDPDFSEYLKLTNDQKILETLELIRPEVPVRCPITGLSGRADIVENFNGEPAILDIKTTCVEDIKFNKEKELEVDRWAAKKKKYPETKHKIQVGLYAHFMNKYKYYTKPITKIGLAYINYTLTGLVESEHECYFDYTPDMDEKLALLLVHLGKERTAFLNGEKSSCEYPYCRAHHLAETKAKGSHK